MRKGRPVGSDIRQGVVEILHYLKQGTGYEIYKIYREVFASATQRSIYYHLKKGLQTKEFAVADVKVETGNYSWGPNATKTYYMLGEEAHPKEDERVKKYLENEKARHTA